MSESLVAQCPFCQTRFRLSQEHLQAAAGNVRCGACLKVFDANPTTASKPDRTADGSAAVSSMSPSTPPRDTGQKPVTNRGGADRTAGQESRHETLMIHDDMDLDDLDLEALGLDESILEEINPAVHSTEPTANRHFDQTELERVLEPESSKSEPEDGHMPEAAPESLPSDPDEEPYSWDMFAESAYEQPDLISQPPIQGDLKQADEQNDFDLSEDFLATPAAHDFETGSSPAQDTGTGTGTAPDPEPAQPAGDNGIYLRGRPADAQASVPQPTFGESVESAEFLDEYEQRHEPQLGKLVDLPDLLDEPILLYEQPRGRRSRYRAVWIALSIMALLGLPAQALFYNFSTLAHGEQTRPYLENICFLAGCELPDRVDIDLIRSSNLMVRPHPEYPNALAIDVILYNRAEFAQPFPVLRMTFNDTRGREILSKRYRPDEYLGGELAGVTLMPPQTPVHVALDMLDPGPQAAGYQLDFLSP